MEERVCSGSGLSLLGSSFVVMDMVFSLEKRFSSGGRGLSRLRNSFVAMGMDFQA